MKIMPVDCAHPDELLVVYYKDGSTGHCIASDRMAIEKALAKAAGEDSFGSVIEDRDTLLRLTAANGDPLVILASMIAGYSLSTRAARRKNAILKRALDDENDDIRHGHSAPEESGDSASDPLSAERA